MLELKVKALINVLNKEGVILDEEVERELNSIIKQENEEDVDIPAITEAKNVILRHTVESQILENGRFTFDEIPFKAACIYCSLQ